MTHLLTLVDTTVWNARGAAIQFPPGVWDLQGLTPIAIAKHRIGMSALGPAGSVTIRCDGKLLDIGDYTRTVRVAPGVIENLTFYHTGAANTDSCVKLFRTVRAQFENCVFVNFYIGIDGTRASTCSIDKCKWVNSTRSVAGLAFLRANGNDDSQAPSPDTYGPGGGYRISDCELMGSNGTCDTTNCFLLKACDGFYAENTHMVGFERALALDPDGTPESYVITDIKFVNCYFDEPSQYAAAPYCVYIGGTVRRNIALASGALVNSLYQYIHFSNCGIRAADYGRHAVFVAVNEGNDWGTASPRRLQDIQFLGGYIRQSLRAGIQINGAQAGAFVEPRGFRVGFVDFDGNNKTAVAGIGSDINGSVHSGTFSNNTFLDPGAAGSDFTISVVVSDDGATDEANASCVVAFNDLSRLTLLPAIRPINVTQSSIDANIIITKNLLPGVGKDIDQDYHENTNGAVTKTVWTYNVPQGSAGTMEVKASGSNASGSKAVAYSWRVGFRRNAGGLTLSSGGSTFTAVGTYNPDAFPTPPTAYMSGTTLNVDVTGVAGEVIDWTVTISAHFSR